MNNISWISVLFFALYAMFLASQSFHASMPQHIGTALVWPLHISVILGIITGLIYLVYYGVIVVWWAPILILVIGWSCVGLFIPFRSKGLLALSLLGFLGWPVCAYLMFVTIPNVD